MKPYHALFETGILVLLILSFPFIAFQATAASESASVKVEPSNVYEPVGENFTITIEIENVGDLYGVDIILSWNASILRCINIKPMAGVEEHEGGILNGKTLLLSNNVSRQGDQYQIVAQSLPPAMPFSGNGSVASLEFNVLQNGTCVLELFAVLASSASSGSSHSIAHSTTNGFFGNASLQQFDWQTPALIASLVIIIVLLVGAILYVKSGRKGKS